MLAGCRARPRAVGGGAARARVEKGEGETRNAIAAWRELPDYASVNLSESDAPAVIATLHRVGVDVEAGLASVADAERFIKLSDHQRALRILIEIGEQDFSVAQKIADDVA